MMQVYRTLWNISSEVHRKHYFVPDYALQPREALERELEAIGELIPEECFIELLGLPYEEIPDIQEKVCYRLAYQRRYKSIPSSHYIITFIIRESIEKIHQKKPEDLPRAENIRSLVEAERRKEKKRLKSKSDDDQETLF